ncbi:HEAT repeat domain-containing protein, partial [candidate division WOR-3 bacterium]|nr:HEAT repeat domain-containing protein [candidate division WOR-3 bacterium]
SIDIGDKDSTPYFHYEVTPSLTKEGMILLKMDYEIKSGPRITGGSRQYILKNGESKELSGPPGSKRKTIIFVEKIKPKKSITVIGENITYLKDKNEVVAEGGEVKIKFPKSKGKDINALLETKSAFAYKKQQIRDIITDIAKRLGLVVFFEESLAFDKDGTASRQLKSKMGLFSKNSTYKEVLGIVLGNELAYRIEGNRIIIARESEKCFAESGSRGKSYKTKTYDHWPVGSVDEEKIDISEYINQLKKGASYKERRSAVFKLCSSGNKSVIPVLIEVLKNKSEHWRVRSTIASRLWDLRDKSAIPALIEVLEDKTEYCRLHEQCVASLDHLTRQYPSERKIVVPVLIEMLKDKNKVTRWSAANALGMIGDESAIPALRKALEDKEIRLRAAYALSHLGDRSVIPLLIDTLRSGDRTSRMNAAWNLGRLGGRESLAALKQASEKEIDNQVLCKIEEAARKIEGTISLLSRKKVEKSPLDQSKSQFRINITHIRTEGGEETVINAPEIVALLDTPASIDIGDKDSTLYFHYEVIPSLTKEGMILLKMDYEMAVTKGKTTGGKRQYILKDGESKELSGPPGSKRKTIIFVEKIKPKDKPDSGGGKSYKSKKEKLTLDDLKNADYVCLYYGKGVRLKNGIYEEHHADSTSKLHVGIYKDKVAFGDLNNDGRDDAVVVIESYSGGSGHFYELAVVINNNGKPLCFIPKRLGDRVIVNSVLINKAGKITVDMIAHSSKDGLAKPTLRKIIEYKLYGYILIQLRENGMAD